MVSMRELARRADVQPATMTRLAKRLGFAGFDEIRLIYADSAREDLGFASRGGRLVERRQLQGDAAIAAEMADTLSRQITALRHPDVLEALAAGAEMLSGARRIYCLGLRASFPVAWHAHYVLSLVREGVFLLDGAGGVGLDPLRNIASDDVLLAVSTHPYTRLTAEAVAQVRDRGGRVFAITDSPVAPIADKGEYTVCVGTESSSFLQTMTPCFAAAEILAALVAGRGGANALAALRRTDEQLAALDTHINTRKRPSGT